MSLYLLVLPFSPRPPLFPPLSLAAAIRSGDFYMFEEDSDVEDADTAASVEDPVEPDDDKNKKLGPLQVSRSLLKLFVDIVNLFFL